MTEAACRRALGPGGRGGVQLPIAGAQDESHRAASSAHLHYLILPCSRH